MDNNKFDETISNSKAESIQKAISLLEAQLNENQNKPIHRPDINVAKTIIKHLAFLFVFLAFCFSVCFLFDYFNLSTPYMLIALGVSALIFIILTFKRFCIDFVLLYQKLAPEKLRHSCLFEPSCSEYMLLAIDKYGAVRGVFKGIKRLLRCHHPNGGVDYP